MPRGKGSKAGSRHTGVVIITLYTSVDMCVHLHVVHCMYKI